jgi:hypothetical protein
VRHIPRPHFAATHPTIASAIQIQLANTGLSKQDPRLDIP